MKPFEELKQAEDLLQEYKPSGDEELDYRQLLALLAQERVLDMCRIDMLKKYKHGSGRSKNYMYREYMVRHKISEFALKLDKKVTDKITGENPEEKSVVAMYVKNRELYPKPVRKK